ncbi:hemerythrin domain-containing protein [Alicyclobacillus tolerans]|uniref:hemerythrin domain-containing protein n=1 Tax=Alicyclobacillus tolerans TaxID=90970 RepID=UPI001F34996A|nr:hemerythrin domain-containing protein [Alicyclobacillus tolerans]MCF8567107.1 hemerythrin domain-containing protein [Alicyclobacillus tolerans]
MEKQPLKRHESLQNLSRHHHHALLMAQSLIRFGSATGQKDRAEMQDELRSFWEHGGRDHFREEEDYLLPEYAKYGDIKHPEIVSMLLEHVKIRSLADEVLTNGSVSETVFVTLGEMLRDHVRREERTVFPMIESALPKAALDKLAPIFSEFQDSSTKLYESKKKN